MRLDKVLKLRVTSVEKARIVESAGSGTISDYIRGLILDSWNPEGFGEPEVVEKAVEVKVSEKRLGWCGLPLCARCLKIGAIPTCPCQGEE